MRNREQPLDLCMCGEFVVLDFQAWLFIQQ